MPTRRKNNRFCHLLGLNKNIANNVNLDKDLPVKDIPTHKHRGLNHGACTNLKYRRLGEVEAVACSIVHNFLTGSRVGNLPS